MLIELFCQVLRLSVLQQYKQNQLKFGLLKGVGQFWSKFQIEGGIPHQPFLHSYIEQWMPYNSVTDSFHTNKETL